MAFSTQKGFQHVPFSDEFPDPQCPRLDGIFLRTYANARDKRSWSMSDNEKSQYLIDLVKCNTYYDAAGDGLRDQQVGQIYPRTDAPSEKSGHKSDLESVKTQKPENKSLNESSIHSPGNRDLLQEIKDKLEELKNQKKINNDDENELLKMLDDLMRSVESRKPSPSTVDFGKDPIEPEKSTDVKYLQNQVNGLRKELSRIRQGKDGPSEKGSGTQQRGDGAGKGSVQYARVEGEKEMESERNALREKIDSLASMEGKICDWKNDSDQFKCFKKKACMLLKQKDEQIRDLQERIEEVENEFREIVKCYKSKEQDRETICNAYSCLKEENQRLKDEINRNNCDLKAITTLQNQIQFLSNELCEKNCAIEQYDLQFQQLLCVIEGLQAKQAPPPSGPQPTHKTKAKKDEHIDELAASTKATLDQISKELEQRQDLENDLAQSMAELQDLRRLSQEQEARIKVKDADAMQEVTRLNEIIADLKAKHQQAIDDLMRQLEDCRNKLKAHTEETKNLVDDISNVQNRNENLGAVLGAVDYSVKYEKEIDDLKAKLDAEMERNRNLQNELDELRKELAKCRGADDRCKQLQDELDNLKKELERCKAAEERCKNLQKELDDLKKELEKKKDLVDPSLLQNAADKTKSLEEKNKALEDKNKALEDQNKSLEAKNKALEDQNKSLEAKNKALEDQNKALEEKNKSLEAKNKALEDQNKALEEKNKSLEARNKALEDQNKSLEEKNKALEAKNKALEDQNKALEEKNKALEAKNKALEDQNKALEEKNKALEAKLKNLQDELDELKKQLAKCKDAEERNKNLQSELDDLRKQLDKKKNFVDPSELQKEVDKNKALEEKLRNLQKELDDLRKELDKCRAAEERCKNLQKELDDLKKELDKKKDLVDPNLLQNANDKNKALEDKNKALEDKNKSLEAKNKALEDQVKGLEDKNKSLEAKLKNLQDELDELKKQLAKCQDAEARNKELEAKIKDLQKDLDALRKQLEQCKLIEERNRNLQKILDDLKNELKQAEAALQDCKNQTHGETQTTPRVRRSVEPSTGRKMQKLNEVTREAERKNYELEIEGHKMTNKLLTNSMAKLGKKANCLSAEEFEREMRCVLDNFVSEICKWRCAKTFHKLTRLQQIGKKIMEYGIYCLTYKDLVYLHQKMSDAALKLKPTCGTSATTIATGNSQEQLCCRCSGRICEVPAVPAVSSDNKMLMEKILKLEHEIQSARDDLQKVKGDSLNSSDLDFSDNDTLRPLPKQAALLTRKACLRRKYSPVSYKIKEEEFQIPTKDRCGGQLD